MSRNTLITAGVIIGALLVVGVLSLLPGALSLGGGGGAGASLPSAPELRSFEFQVRDEITLQVPVPLPGATLIPGVTAENGVYTMTPFAALILLSGAIIVPIIITGLVLYFLLGRLLTNVTEQTLTSDAYQEKAQTFQQKQDEYVKERKKTQPPDKMPEHVRPGWSGISTVLGGAAMFALFGTVVVANFIKEPELFIWAANLASVGLLIGLFVTTQNYTRALVSLVIPLVLGLLGFLVVPALIITAPGATGPSFLAVGMVIALFVSEVKLSPASTEEEAAPVEWGLVWVVFTGVVIIGVGLGVMMWVRTGAAAEESFRALQQLF